MTMKIQDLCRLCAKKHEISKDLLDENNKGILDLIRQFTQIAVTECDNMPTKVCLDCEEKMVSFQLFILECYKVQDTLRKLCLQACSNFGIKLEDDVSNYNVTVIKSEVKDEISAEDLLNSALEAGEAISYGDDFQDNNDSDADDTDNVTIASLKESKIKFVKKKELTEEEKAEFTQILNKNDLKVDDLVKLECIQCVKRFKSWPNLRVHFFKTHKSKPIIYCLCGFAIKSKSVLYKHVTEHKVENKKMKKDVSSQESEEEQGYSSLKINDFVNFTCTHCNKQYSSWYTLKAHTQKSHRSPPVVQCSCGITLKSKSVMYKHVQDHKNRSTLSCDQCSKILKTVEALNKHKIKHIPKSERKYCCASCDKVFNNKDLLKSHERSHIPIEERKVFGCNMCDLKFTTRSSAASHKRVVHDKVKAYVCDLCGYACGTNGELRQHRAIHSDDKPFVCKKCGKPFKTYSNLKTHMDIHEDTSYVCYVCNRVLNSRRTLRKHLLVHEDKCRHVCSYCNKAFKRRQTLKVHMYTHTGDKPLSCKWCEERFSYASTLRSHRLRCHPDKMAAVHYGAFAHAARLPAQPEDYIKSDLAAINNATKNEVEAIQIHIQ